MQPLVPLTADPGCYRAESAGVFDLGILDKVVAPNRVIVGFKRRDWSQSGGNLAATTADGVGKNSAKATSMSCGCLPAVELRFDVKSVTSQKTPRLIRERISSPSVVTSPAPGQKVVLRQKTTAPWPASQPENEGELEAGPAAPGVHPFLKFQYAAQLTQAAAAWQLVAGSPAIKIAILDEGVDAQHPDLRDAIVNGFDAVDGDANQQPNLGRTRNLLRRLAAAIPNNDLGWRGMGGGCRCWPCA